MHEFPNGKRYIGQTTTSLDKRFANGTGYKNQPDIAAAIAEFGWHSVKTYILYRDIPINELHRYETLCIDRWQTYVDGLNSTRGNGHVSDETRQKLSDANRGKKRLPSMLGKKHTAETRQKMSDAKRGENNPNFGKTPSTETRQKLSDARRGKKHTNETRQKISDAQQNISAETRQKLSDANRGENNPNFGKTHTNETRQKISETKRRNRLEKRGQDTLF